MKTINILSLILISIIGIILCFVLVINIFGYRSNIANEITGDKIKEVKIGMTLEQVISILGKPYEIDFATRHHNHICENPRLEFNISVNKNTDIIHLVDSIYNDTNYCCAAYEETKTRFGKGVTLTYTKRPPPLIIGLVYYEMLWVHLDSNYCVSSVYAKKYEGFEDSCIYALH